MSETSQTSPEDEVPITKSRKYVVWPDPQVYPEFNENFADLDFTDESSTVSKGNKELSECTKKSLPDTGHDQESIEGDAVAFVDNFGADLGKESVCRTGKETVLGFERNKRALTTLFTTPKVDIEDTVTRCCSGERPPPAKVRNLFAKKFISLLFNREGVPMRQKEILEQISEEGGIFFQINYIGKLAHTTVDWTAVQEPISQVQNGIKKGEDGVSD